MKIRRLSVVLALVLLSSINAENQKNVEGLRHDKKADEKKISASLKIDDDASKNTTDKVREVVTSAMKTPEKRKQIGEVVPIIRGMSAPQKLAMATLISTRISRNETTSPPLEEVRSLFSKENKENASRELMLPISMDIAKIISEDTPDNASEEEEAPEELPEAQELRYIRSGARRRPLYRPPPRRPGTLNRRNVYTDPPRTPVIRPPRRPTEVKRGPTEKECTFFTKTVCLEATDYPHEAITRSLRSNKEMVAALLTDYKPQDQGGTEEKFPIALPLESKFENRYESNEIKRRSDISSAFENVEEGFTCPSIVKYARPQLARAASGVWKYIINTGEHTQTLRLEKCSNPQASCSFISENYRSSCVQVYNYHRLLTWDTKLGLHMDIFKVPTCCSCHVHGYAEIFPPHQKDPPQKAKESFPGADFATDQKEDFEEISKPPVNYVNKYNPGSSYDSTIVSSNKKQVAETTSRPSFTLPGRTRKKPSLALRPFEKLPQQHAPNTRAPGYTGPLMKPGRTRPGRPPFRRESSSYVEDYVENPINNTADNTRYSQPYDQEMDASSRLQNGGFDEEYHEPQRRINYNYHPIIDFFKPEASMLQSSEVQTSSTQTDNNSWKPMISS